MTTIKFVLQKISPEKLFMISVMLVNGGNYLYNLILGRLLGPEVFSEAALLVTFLLVLSFLGMTFQLATAKYTILFSGDEWLGFEQLMYRYALGLGVIIGVLIFGLAPQLQDMFQTTSSFMFKTFATAIPFYFLMSVNRGKYQGKQDYKSLSMTYQTEMWSRLLFTLLFLWLVPLESSLLIAVGITLSFLFGLIPSNFKWKNLWAKHSLSVVNKKMVLGFIGITLCYELTLIIINNSDILLVKHYFPPKEAGMYSSLALIGRMVYFVAWMFVMLLLPEVIQRQKQGLKTAPILFRYVAYIGTLSFGIVLISLLFPKYIITLMFGDAYLSMAPLLWQYALATSLFAIGNIFSYYFLSLNEYVPIMVSGVMGIIQVAMITIFHSSLSIVVQVQILAMTMLLVFQVLFFIKKNILDT